MKIKFINTLNISDNFLPKPSSEYVPFWYKNTDSYINKEKKPDGNGKTTATIKKCMPVFDAIAAGYIITSYVDVFVTQKYEEEIDKKIPYFEWSSENPIEFHDFSQAPLYPGGNKDMMYPKWINPWGIKTPSGYSTIFLPPMHRDLNFSILPGIVDTDVYFSPVNFPFILKEGFEGLIPAGTPIAQVIPFKRDSWKTDIGNNKDLIEVEKISKNLKVKFFDRYKNMYRKNKEYK